MSMARRLSDRSVLPDNRPAGRRLVLSEVHYHRLACANADRPLPLDDLVAVPPLRGNLVVKRQPRLQRRRQENALLTLLARVDAFEVHFGARDRHADLNDRLPGGRATRRDLTRTQSIAAVVMPPPRTGAAGAGRTEADPRAVVDADVAVLEIAEPLVRAAERAGDGAVCRHRRAVEAEAV